MLERVSQMDLEANNAFPRILGSHIQELNWLKTPETCPVYKTFGLFKKWRSLIIMKSIPEKIAMHYRFQ